MEAKERREGQKGKRIGYESNSRGLVPKNAKWRFGGRAVKHLVKGKRFVPNSTLADENFAGIKIYTLDLCSDRGLEQRFVAQIPVFKALHFNGEI